MKAQNLYVYGEDPSASILYFTLDTSRHEPALKRVNIIMSAGKFSPDRRVQLECHSLACELMDVEQIVQRHIALVRDVFSAELANNKTFTYLLERIEDQPLEIKVELLGTLAAVEARFVSGLHDSWHQMFGEMSRFNHRFDTFLFKLRARVYDGSNRDARAAMAREEEAKKDEAAKPVASVLAGKKSRNERATAA